MRSSIVDAIRTQDRFPAIDFAIDDQAEMQNFTTKAEWRALWVEHRIEGENGARPLIRVLESVAMTRRYQASDRGAWLATTKRADSVQLHQTLRAGCALATRSDIHPAPQTPSSTTVAMALISGVRPEWSRPYTSTGNVAS